MSRIMNDILKQEEQGKDILKEIDYYSDGEPYSPEQIEEELKNDPEFQVFLNELEQCCF